MVWLLRRRGGGEIGAAHSCIWTSDIPALSHQYHHEFSRPACSEALTTTSSGNGDMALCLQWGGGAKRRQSGERMQEGSH